ncbi:hypothetical protein Y1Q_0024450 [Alligator mississippiensis]|uniref:Uncharacterized protein n=1 Tax=Alligator mississippiensis TaxID=8496 RepID=A0A151N792_ALLMI|nr:hypothetical protein Y1Q_0024450 [Alligator mississippiensis]
MHEETAMRRKNGSSMQKSSPQASQPAPTLLEGLKGHEDKAKKPSPKPTISLNDPSGNPVVSGPTKADGHPSEDASTEGLLTQEQKNCLFGILKDFLQEPSYLRDGAKMARCCGAYTLELVYGKRECELSVLAPSGSCHLRRKLPTGEMYLDLFCHRGEPLTFRNLQRVQGELAAAGVLSEKLQACFSLAISKFCGELGLVQKNTRLEIGCAGGAITFVSGEGRNSMIVYYDDNEKRPRYKITISDWWLKLFYYLRENLGDILAQAAESLELLQKIIVFLRAICAVI